LPVGLLAFGWGRQGPGLWLGWRSWGGLRVSMPIGLLQMLGPNGLGVNTVAVFLAASVLGRALCYPQPLCDSELWRVSRWWLVAVPFAWLRKTA
jgi:hypothetical protein